MTDMIVAGAGTSAVNGTYVENGTYGGRPKYQKGSIYIVWFSTEWEITDMDFYLWYRSTDNVATPDLATTWLKSPNGSLPVPTVTAASSGQNLTLHFLHYARLRSN